jgi:hypothetical protein
MGGWIQIAPDAWQWSKDHNFGEQKSLPRHKYESQFHKGKSVVELDTFNNKAQKFASQAQARREEMLKAQGRSNTGRLRVGTRIAFAKYPEKGARQMVLMLEKLEEFGDGGITVGMFWEKIEGQLPTKQSVDRVYKHYHREMVDKGYIRILS